VWQRGTWDAEASTAEAAGLAASLAGGPGGTVRLALLRASSRGFGAAVKAIGQIHVGRGGQREGEAETPRRRDDAEVTVAGAANPMLDGQESGRHGRTGMWKRRRIVGLPAIQTAEHNMNIPKRPDVRNAGWCPTLKSNMEPPSCLPVASGSLRA
jgi:hypothetical protein